MNVNLQILGHNITSRFHTNRKPRNEGHRYTGTRCLHSEGDPNQPDATPVRCTNRASVVGRQNGFLCNVHQHILNHPQQIEVDQRVDCREIADLDAHKIYQEFKFGSKYAESLRLTDFRSCRRQWNQRHRPTEAKLVDLLIH